MISSFTPDFISSIVSMGFFLAKVGILPETVETKDEELRKVISVISRGSCIAVKLAHNYNYGSITDSTSVTIPPCTGIIFAPHTQCAVMGNYRVARLQVVSYFSLQGYCTRAEKPRAARNEDVWWFPIALDEIRTRRILREKADCKQSTVWHEMFAGSNFCNF